VVGVNPALERPGRAIHGTGAAGVAAPVGRVGTGSDWEGAGEATDGEDFDGAVVVVVVVDPGTDGVAVRDPVVPVDPKGVGAAPGRGSVSDPGHRRLHGRDHPADAGMGSRRHQATGEQGMYGLTNPPHQTFGRERSVTRAGVT
jgi:hypothetical protein